METLHSIIFHSFKYINMRIWQYECGKRNQFVVVKENHRTNFLSKGKMLQCSNKERLMDGVYILNEPAIPRGNIFGKFLSQMIWACSRVKRRERISRCYTLCSPYENNYDCWNWHGTRQIRDDSVPDRAWSRATDAIWQLPDKLITSMPLK